MNIRGQSTQESISITTTQENYEFPKNLRTLVIDDEIIQNIQRYMNGDDILKVKCDRCTSIYKDDIFNEDNELNKIDDNTFSLYLSGIQSSFTLLAYCESSDESYCIFPLDLSNYGTHLLYYDHIAKDDNSDPGVEEIYDWNSGESTENRLFTSYRQQLMKSRQKLYATKNWKGSISPVIQNIQDNPININVTYSLNNNNVKIIFMSNGYIIPLNTQLYVDANDQELKEYLNQVGINITTPKESIDSKDLTFDSDGCLVVNSSFFDKEKLKLHVQAKEIQFLDLNTSYYSMNYLEPIEIKPAPVELQWWVYLIIAIVAVVIVVIVIILVVKCRKSKDDISA